MNNVLENPVQAIRKSNTLAFILLLVSVLTYQATILLESNYISEETLEFSLSNQVRVLSLNIEKNLISAAYAPDYFSRDRYINKARQNINSLSVIHHDLLIAGHHITLFHPNDDIAFDVYNDTTPYLEKMRDSVLTAVAYSEKLELNPSEQQALSQSVKNYQQHQENFATLIDHAIDLSSTNAKNYLFYMPRISWGLVGLIFTVMLLNHRLIHEKSVKAARAQFEQLETKMEFQDALLNSEHEAVIVVSTEGVITSFSNSASRMFGYQYDEIINKQLCQLLPNLCQAQLNKHAKIRAGKFEAQEQRKNGTPFTVLIQFEELKTAHQHLFIGFIRDLTDEKAVESKLKYSEAKYRAVVEDQTNLICRYDLNFNLSFVNNSYCRYFKKSKEELLNSCFINILPLDVQQWLQASHNKLSPENPISEHQSSIINADGHTEWMQWTTHAIFDHNGLVEYQGIGTITTQQKEAEIKLLKAKQEAEEANKAKSQFLSNISHELKTPLNAILGFSQLLETDEAEPLTPEQAESVKHIYKAGKLLLALIGDVLELSKIETGNVKLNIEEVAVNEIILESLTLIDNIAKENNINIKTRFDPLAITMIAVDPLRFKQVLINLLSNAIKYNSENGLITLRSKVENNRVRISVKDSGKGIDESKLIELFEPFNRLGAEHTDIEGTGIGLCIAKNLVERMGGVIGVLNNKGAGCCFWVEFPIIPSSPTSLEEHATGLTKKLQNEFAYLQESLNTIGLIKKPEDSNNTPPPQASNNIKTEFNSKTIH